MTTTVNLVQLTVDPKASFFVGSGNTPYKIEPIALALSVIDNPDIPKAWPRLRYILHGTPVSPLLEELAAADSLIEFIVSSRAEYVSGADIVRPGAATLNISNRYAIQIPFG